MRKAHSTVFVPVQAWGQEEFRVPVGKRET